MNRKSRLIHFSVPGEDKEVVGEGPCGGDVIVGKDGEVGNELVCQSDVIAASLDSPNAKLSLEI